MLRFANYEDFDLTDEIENVLEDITQLVDLSVYR